MITLTTKEGWSISLREDGQFSLYSQGKGTTTVLSKELKDELSRAIEVGRRWATTGTGYFILFEGDFTLLPYMGKEMDEQSIGLTLWEKNRLGKMLQG